MSGPVCRYCGEEANTVPYSMAGEHHKYGPLRHRFMPSVPGDPAKRARYYLGYAGCGTVREIFASRETPTPETAPKYDACVGPFRTKRGAKYMRDNPGPCIITVQDAERLAKGWRIASGLTKQA